MDNGKGMLGNLNRGKHMAEWKMSPPPRSIASEWRLGARKK